MDPLGAQSNSNVLPNKQYALMNGAGWEIRIKISTIIYFSCFKINLTLIAIKSNNIIPGYSVFSLLIFTTNEVLNLLYVFFYKRKILSVPGTDGVFLDHQLAVH